jgi:G3E family GTPase
MSTFEHLTRKVVGNMKKYSLIEFYHEQSDLEQRLKELSSNLEQFNCYLPNTVVVIPDPKKAKNDILVDLRERINSFIQKVDHDFGLKNYQHIIANVKDERVKDIYRTLGPFDHFEHYDRENEVESDRALNMDFQVRRSGAQYRG